jgi:predicted small secreted protein
MRHAFTVAALALLAGCHNTAQGVKQDSKSAADKTGAALEKAADKTGKGLQKAADKTGKGLQKAADKIDGH